MPRNAPRRAPYFRTDSIKYSLQLGSKRHIGGKIGENLRAALPHLPLSKQLTTIKCDVGLDVGLADLVPKQAVGRGMSGLDAVNWSSGIVGSAAVGLGRVCKPWV